MAIIEKGKQLETAIKITAEATGKDLLEDDVSTDTNLPEQLRAAALAENVKKLQWILSKKLSEQSTKPICG